MYTTLTTLLNLLDSKKISNTSVIKWGSPVPSFGDLSNSKVATLGLNPSNKEFVDEMGKEIIGKSRRFHTLKSLGIKTWSDIDSRHIQLIIETCTKYFLINPYDRWFKVLDTIISGTQSSYYNQNSSACHLDLIPYATSLKWNELSRDQRSKLLSLSDNILGLLLRDSPIRILILNGKTVIDVFQNISGVHLQKRKMSSWSLPRHSSEKVDGIAYQGTIDSLSGVQFGRNLLVLGFNHNLQSSFGVTKKVIIEIQKWISRESREFLCET